MPDSVQELRPRPRRARRRDQRAAIRSRPGGRICGPWVSTGFTRRIRFAVPALLFAALVACEAADAQSIPTSPAMVELKLTSGGSLSGAVVAFDDAAVVVVHDGTPYAFAWLEVEPSSACVARHQLLVRGRGGEGRLTAEDHLQLGRYALARRQATLAAQSFRRAMALDGSFEIRVKDAYAQDRRRRESWRGVPDSWEPEAAPVAWDATRTERSAGALDAELVLPFALTEAVPDEVRAQVLDIYRGFGERVQEVLGGPLALVETEHFLIWTDWESRTRPALAEWCEGLYATLCALFDLAPSEPVFLAKCPVFCWQTRGRFERFARGFDGHDVTNAEGYTRSIERNGHVHVVLVRGGRSREAYDRFAATLVHEGAHAFIHRLYTPRLIPHWVNEGMAELTAERVLGERCFTAEKADLLATQYVRYNWPIEDFLSRAGPIEVFEYPLAHSVVAHLESLGRGRLAGLVRGLKEGQTLEAALAGHYQGMTLEQLEDGWRNAVGAGITPPEPNAARIEEARLEQAEDGAAASPEAPSTPPPAP